MKFGILVAEPEEYDAMEQIIKIEKRKRIYELNFSEGTMDLLKEEEILTLKCNGCGAEIIINRLELSQARL